LNHASSEDLQKFEQIKDSAEKKINILKIEGTEEKLNTMIDSPLWEELSNPCLTCAACTYLCPTCYCFDIQDVAKEDRGKRVRVWDSCMFRIYTLEASGHNPRPDKSRRMRQRVMHKFNYYPFLHKEYGCVGCGRCIKYCPVNIDIRETIRKVVGSNE
jgi:ferredoxin